MPQPFDLHTVIIPRKPLLKSPTTILPERRVESSKDTLRRRLAFRNVGKDGCRGQDVLERHARLALILPQGLYWTQEHGYDAFHISKAFRLPQYKSWYPSVNRPRQSDRFKPGPVPSLSVTDKPCPLAAARFALTGEFLLFAPFFFKACALPTRFICRDASEQWVVPRLSSELSPPQSLLQGCVSLRYLHVHGSGSSC